jgi:putative ABC transport system permease protein
MFRSYFAITLRHLTAQKLYSAINIVGLAVGIACFILIGLFVRHELSYDQHYANADRIYRVSRDFLNQNLYLAANAPQVAGLLKQDFAEVENAARIYCCGELIVGTEDLSSYERALPADNELFEIFDFEWLSGDPASALVEPGTIVLTESAARKYFGRTDSIGESLTLENQIPLRVTGVIRDLPDTTHLQFDMLLSMPTVVAAYGRSFVENWGSNNFHTYVLLAEGADTSNIDAQANSFFDRHMAEGSGANARLATYGLTDIHLQSNRDFEISPSGSLGTVYAFGAVGAFILLIACINFMNLATARSAQRAKEVGVRKVAGAERWQIIVQFLGETILLAAVAVALAVALIELMLPTFNAYVQQDLTFDYLGDLRVLGGLVLLAVAVGLAAGAYPALFLSAFQPARVLKGDATRGSAAATLRRGLVVLQFAISIALIISTAIVLEQARFARTIELGYDREQIVVLAGSPTGGLGPQWESMKRRLLAHPEITHVAGSRLIPGNEHTDAVAIRAEGGDPDGRPMPHMYVDLDFFETYGIELLAGRTFSEDFATDRSAEPDEDNPQTAGAFVLNALAARELGWRPEEAVGRWFEVSRGPRFERGIRGPIVGVVADIHFESLRNAIKPFVYMVPQGDVGGFPAFRQASLRLTENDLGRTLDYIDSVWAEYLPDVPVQRRFLESDFEALYLREERQSVLLSAFSALAIFVACLGLLGLTSYTTEHRRKEIGVRKVLGGTVWSIVRLFTGEFSRLVIAANVIAWPVAYFLMQSWLENFAYRIDMNLITFAGGALAALLVALLTVGTIAARAAGAKPGTLLRYE